MANSSDQSSISGYLTVIEEEKISATFTDVELYAESGHSVLLRAKRYGQWWMLKGLNREIANCTVYEQMLRKEFDIMIRMHHPTIINASAIESINGEFAGTYIVMEWINGLTLDRWLKSNPNLPRKLKVLDQLLAAANYIHSKSIVHRDLKPENLMVVSGSDYLKVIDFGLADAEFYSILKQPAGTPGYMSPEQQTANSIDVRNDIYSIGAIMERMGLPKRFRKIIATCMGDISKRYRNVDELEQAIHKASARKPGMVAAIIGIVVVIIGLFIALWQRVHDDHSGEVAPPAEPTIEHTAPAPATTVDSLTPAPVAASTPTPAAEAPAKLTRFDEALRRGIEAFEVEAAIMDAKFDTLSHALYPSEFGKPTRAWKNFYYSESPSYKLTEDEYDRLYQSLQNYSALRYGLWQHKVDSIKNANENSRPQ